MRKMVKHVVYEMVDMVDGLSATYDTRVPEVRLSIESFPIWGSERLDILINFMKELKSEVKKLEMEREAMKNFSENKTGGSK